MECAEDAPQVLAASVQCRLFVVFFVFGNFARETMLLELLSIPIDIFKDPLVEQFGFAPALAEPRPGMFPVQPHNTLPTLTPPTCGTHIAQLASLLTTVVLPKQRNFRICLGEGASQSRLHSRKFGSFAEVALQ
jgi:hypothetical protein